MQHEHASLGYVAAAGLNLIGKEARRLNHTSYELSKMTPEDITALELSLVALGSLCIETQEVLALYRSTRGQ